MTKMRAVLVLGLVVLSAAALALPRGSYIRRPVNSVSDLIRHTKQDPVVMDRFRRHFRLTGDQVVAYFGTLRMARLARAGAYTVFNVREDGVVRSRVLNLPKGELVFADSNGRAILQKVCGNPMVWEIPQIGTSVVTAEPVGVTELGGETSPLELMTLTEPAVADIPIEPVVATPVVGSAVSGVIGGGAPVLWPLLALGGIPFLLRGQDDVEPIPEPATIAALAVGFAWVARRRKKA